MNYKTLLRPKQGGEEQKRDGFSDAVQVGCLEGTLHFPQRGKFARFESSLSSPFGRGTMPAQTLRRPSSTTNLHRSFLVLC
jgi:hypothetical protein